MVEVELEDNLVSALSSSIPGILAIEEDQVVSVDPSVEENDDVKSVDQTSEDEDEEFLAL
jgi:hypothetical protein